MSWGPADGVFCCRSMLRGRPLPAPMGSPDASELEIAAIEDTGLGIKGGGGGGLGAIAIRFDFPAACGFGPLFIMA